MFWRPDPRGEEGKQEGNKEWPRNGSLLTGTQFEHNGEKVTAKLLLFAPVSDQPIDSGSK